MKTERGAEVLYRLDWTQRPKLGRPKFIGVRFEIPQTPQFMDQFCQAIAMTDDLMIAEFHNDDDRYYGCVVEIPGEVDSDNWQLIMQNLRTNVRVVLQFSD